MLRAVIRRLLLALALLASMARAADAPPVPRYIEIFGQRTEIDTDTQIAILTGGVRAVAPPYTITADEARYDNRTGVAVITGNVVLTWESYRLLADRLEYRNASRTFTTGSVRFGSYPYYVEGSSAEGSDAEIAINDAVVTLGEPGPFAPTWAAGRLTINRTEETISASSMRVGVGPRFGIRVPQINYRFDQELVADLSVSSGYRDTLGAYLDIGTRLPVGPSLQLGANVGIFTDRGFLFGPSASYSAAQSAAALSGEFNSGFINDHGDKLFDIVGKPVPENRGYITWNHRQEISDQLSLAATATYWSDSEVVRDFDSDTFFAVQQPDSFVSALHTGRNHHLGVFARIQANDFHEAQERLPEFTFDLLPHDIGHGLYEQFHASLSRLRDDPVGAGPVLHSDRLDIYYGLRRPITAGDWLAVTPVAGGRFTRYENTSGASAPGGYARVVGELGVDAEMRIAGVFDYENPVWRINGLRHLLTPRIGYRYIPDADRGRDRIPMIDRRAFETYLPPIGLDATRNIDDLDATHVVRLGIDNALQTRDPAYGSRNLVAFNTAADFRIERSPGQPDVSEIHSELVLTPAPWLRWTVYESFVPQNFTLRQLNTSLALVDGDAWSLRFLNHYLRRDTEKYGIEADRRFNEIFTVQARARFDARRDRLNELGLTLRQNVANTWDLEYSVAVYDGPRRESDFSFRFKVSSIGF